MQKNALSLRIGHRLHVLRVERGLSLDALAHLTSVSKPMLGQIERGLSNPTVATLWKIASGLNVPFTAFVSDEPTVRLLKAEAQTVFFDDQRRFQAYSTYAIDGSPVELFRLRLLPGCKRTSESHGVGVQECMTVAFGAVQITLGEQVFQVEAGDSLQFQADMPHVYENLSAQPADAHLAILYPSKQPKSSAFPG
jgi:transcriptional regulator with XRE-family HTH domain